MILWFWTKSNDCTTLDITFRMYSRIWTSKFQQLEYCMSLMINEWALLHGDRLEKKVCKIGFFCLVIFWNETLFQGSHNSGPSWWEGFGMLFGYQLSCHSRQVLHTKLSFFCACKSDLRCWLQLGTQPKAVAAGRKEPVSGGSLIPGFEIIIN